MKGRESIRNEGRKTNKGKLCNLNKARRDTRREGELLITWESLENCRGEETSKYVWRRESVTKKSI